MYTTTINLTQKLGEMKPQQFAESTLLEDRTLIQYTMRSAEEDLARIDHIESNKDELLKDCHVSRIDLIG